MILPASYANGFAPRDGQPLHPELWKSCVFAAAPCLGPTGLTLRDWSGFGNHGTLTGMDTTTDWVVNGKSYAVDFDGTDDYVLTGFPSVSVAKCHTLSVWARVTNSGATKPILAIGSGGTGFSALQNVGGEAVEFQAWDLARNPYFRATVTHTGIWTHFAAVLGAGTMSLWVNGTQVASLNNATTQALSLGNQTQAAIGRTLGYGNYLTGFVADARVYNRDVSSQEIRLLATRPGIAYEMAPRRRSRIFAGGFQAYWLARKAQIIGGGL